MAQGSALPWLMTEELSVEVFVLAVMVLAVVIIASGVKIVPQGNRYTVERFGRYTRTLQPGLALIVPFVDRVGRKINIMEQVLDIPAQSVITKDNATVSVNGVVYYMINDASRAAYEVNDLDRALSNLAITSIRSVIGEMDLDQALSSRDTMNARLLAILDEASDPWGTSVRRVEISDLEPDPQLVQAMSMQMQAERKKRAQILEAEGLREAEIKRAEGEKQAQILEADGRLEAARRDAEARERLAAAEAKAAEVVSEAVKNGDKTAIQYFIAQGYTKALETIGAAENQKVIMLPLEASNLIGSVNGIKELLDAKQ